MAMVELTEFQRELSVAMGDGRLQALVDLTSEQADQLLVYANAVVEKNKVMNLTAIVEALPFYERHFLDSYLLVGVLAELGFGAESTYRAADLGTGAGFPGIPMSVAHSNASWTLMDALDKRIRFLAEIKSQLCLSKVTTLHARAEQVGQQVDYREQFDVVTARALAALPVLCEYALPLTKVGGYFIAMKGPGIDEEWQAAKRAIELLGGKVLKCHSGLIPGTDQERTLLVIRKEKSCPKRYPRPMAKIKQASL